MQSPTRLIKCNKRGSERISKYIQFVCMIDFVVVYANEQNKSGFLLFLDLDGISQT